MCFLLKEINILDKHNGHYCYFGKRHSGTLGIKYPLLCNISLNIIGKAVGSSSLYRFSKQAVAVSNLAKFRLWPYLYT